MLINTCGYNIPKKYHNMISYAITHDDIKDCYIISCQSGYAFYFNEFFGKIGFTTLTIPKNINVKQALLCIDDVTKNEGVPLL